jgi:nitrogen fixation protein FixH
MSETENLNAQESRKAGRTVLFWFLGFFGVCIAVNGIFVYKAVSTFKGVVAEDAYQIGLHYNDILKEARERKNEEQHSP